MNSYCQLPPTLPQNDMRDESPHEPSITSHFITTDTPIRNKVDSFTMSSSSPEPAQYASEEPENKRRRLSNNAVKNEYKGYSFPTADDCSVPVLTAEEATPEYLFSEFISQRRPCVINTLPLITGGTSGVAKLQIDKAKLVEVAGEEVSSAFPCFVSWDHNTGSRFLTQYTFFAQMVQVERRLNSEEIFGQNRSQERQLEMTVSSFCEKLSNSKDGAADLLYLSTQESPENEIFTTPCKQLLKAGTIRDKLSWAGDLALQTCNLWMGKSETGTSSGLHHDFHDNFYLLIKGSKSFRLFSPDSAFSMQTYGEIERIHANGLISYVGSETNIDGSPIDVASDEEDDENEEEAVTLGKGFDYESEEDDGDYDGEVFENGRDDFDEMTEESKDADAESSASAGGGTARRPNNFSQIDLHGRSVSEFGKDLPTFSNQRECRVNLEAGQSLYLPAGWFHEVTSKSSKTATEHIALNYWYQPPCL
jgi:hypothetical protein